MKRLIIISLTLLSATAFAQNREPVSERLVGTPNQEQIRQPQNHTVVGEENTETKTQTEARAQQWIAAQQKPETVVEQPQNQITRTEAESIKPYVNKYNETFVRNANEQSIYPAKEGQYNYKRQAADIAEAKKSQSLETKQTSMSGVQKQTVSDAERMKLGQQKQLSSIQATKGKNPGINDAERQKMFPPTATTPALTNPAKPKSKGDIHK